MRTRGSRARIGCTGAAARSRRLGSIPLVAVFAFTACLSPGAPSITDGATSTTSSGATTDTTAPTTTTSTEGSTTTSTTINTTTADSTETACPFICPPDHAISMSCDQWAQDCPEGQKCNAWANDGGGAWNDTKCVPVDPNPDPVGAPCMVVDSGVSGLDSCVKGAICWDVNQVTKTGTCVAYCSGTESACIRDPGSCCAPGTVCSINASGVVTLCLYSCNPILEDCEGAAEVCYPVDDAFQCAPDVSGDMGAVGDPCEYVNTCDPGTYCGDPATFPGCDPNAPGCCVPFCPLDAPACPPGTVCAPWYDPLDTPPGYENLGSCVIPG